MQYQSGSCQNGQKWQKPLSVFTQPQPLHAYLFFKNIKLQARKFNTLGEDSYTRELKFVKIWILNLELQGLKKSGLGSFVPEQLITLENYDTKLCN